MNYPVLDFSGGCVFNFSVVHRSTHPSIPSQEGRNTFMVVRFLLLESYVSIRVTSSVLSKKFKKSHNLFPSREGLGVGI